VTARVRQRFRGAIAGAGSTSGTRVVVGRWRESPLGSFSDVMVETAAGQRLLLAPDPEVAAFVGATYFFDETRVEPVEVREEPARWVLCSPSLELELGLGRRTPVGLLLRAVPTRLAEAPAWCALTDPAARLLLRGVRTRGSAGNGRREWYGATDSRVVTGLRGRLDGVDLGRLAPVDPPCSFGFSSTPRRPSLTEVVTTVESAQL
jgi:hypothetical protein